MLLNALLTSGVHTKKEVISNGGSRTHLSIFLWCVGPHTAICGAPRIMSIPEQPIASGLSTVVTLLESHTRHLALCTQVHPSHVPCLSTEVRISLTRTLPPTLTTTICLNLT